MKFKSVKTRNSRILVLHKTGMFLILLIFANFVFAQDIPYEEGKVYVCPLATKIEEINPRCDCRIDLILNETITKDCQNKTYEMTLTISEEKGKEYFAILGFENGGAGINFSPKAKLNKDYFTERVNQEIIFDASLSSDQNNDPLEFFFDFGDGSVVTTKEPIISHSYQKEGQYDLKLTVSDGMEKDTILSKVNILPSLNSFFSGRNSNYLSFLSSPLLTSFSQTTPTPFILGFEKKGKYLKEEKAGENENLFLEKKESIINKISEPSKTPQDSFLKENQKEIKRPFFTFFEKLPFAGFFSFSFSKMTFFLFTFVLIIVIIFKSKKNLNNRF